MIQQLELVPHPTYILNPEVRDIELPQRGEPIALDLETNGDTPWRDSIRVISLRTTEQYLIIPQYYDKQELIELFTRIQQNENTVVCHNTKFDGGFIFTHYGILLKNLWCTLLGSQILGGGSRKFTHDLVSVLSRHLHVQRSEDKKELQKSFLSNAPLTSEQLNYAAADAEHLVPLRAKLLEELEDKDLLKVVGLENKLTPVLIEMEALGCLIDVDAWKAMLKSWEITKRQMIVDLDAEVMRVYPMMLFCNINYGSPKQVLGLFKKLGLPVPTKEDKDVTKESVDEDTLDNYLNENSGSKLSDFIIKLKDYREYEKLLSTYGDSFLERLDSNNYIHTSYGQCTTTTARMNSKNPNLQNIPSGKSGAGAIVRNYFIAPPGYKMITCDMSGAEIALAADFSKDDLLMRSLREGIDMHSELASISATIIYGRPVQISKSKEPLNVGKTSIIPVDFREIHKSATFSKFYKGGAKRIYGVLARYINPVTPASRRMTVANKISEAIDAALPKLNKFLTAKIDEANSKGYLVTTKLMRRRYFDSKVYGEAANAPIQGSNAEAIKIAMINIHKYLSKQHIGRIVLSVHDEVVCIVKQEYAEIAAAYIKDQMASALSYFLEELEGGATVTIDTHWHK